MTVSEYRSNPCGLLSIPYWKAQKITIPEHMLIVHHSEYSDDLLQEYMDTVYFRLLHKFMHNIKSNNKLILPPEFHINSIEKTMFQDLVELINNSYTHLGITVDIDQVEDWTKAETYEPQLWTGIFKEDRIIGAIVVDYDKVTKEAIIEWMQVLPEYRSLGFASALINYSLDRLCGHADFVTVSGMVNNKTNPEGLYRKCGFSGDDLWHVMVKKEIIYT